MNDRLTLPDRLNALAESGLLSSETVLPWLDRVTALAASAIDVPVTLATVLDGEMEHILSVGGDDASWLGGRRTPASHSFCQFVVAGNAPLLIGDARQDPTFREHHAVTNYNIVAYAGVPIHDERGHPLGALCAIQRSPREWLPEDIAALQTLAAQVTLELKVRAQSRMLTKSETSHRLLDAHRRQLTRLTLHDLRTPLTALLLGLQMIERNGTLNPRQTDNLAVCLRSASQMHAIVDELLDIAALEQRGPLALSRHLHRPADLIVRAVQQVQPLAMNGLLDLGVEIVDDLPTVQCDGDKVIRVLTNLLSNAVKFTEPGGKVRVKAQPAPRVDGTPPAIVFHVVDTGIGMADTSRIFDEGVRLDASATTRRSAGLGLTFCKMVVEAHGGQVAVQSAPNQGSTFSFTLPIGPA